MRPLHPANHFEHLSRLLRLEADAEAEQLAERARRQAGPEAERSGNCLLKLVIRDERPALAGRAIVTLGKRDQTQALPWNRFSVGSPVLLTEEGVERSPGWRGVVCWRDANALEVALRDSPEPERDRPTFRLDAATDEISRQRQQAALDFARKVDRGRLTRLRDVLLGSREPKFNEPEPLSPLDGGLNASQIAAVEHALSAVDVAIIHGPPGTGKTRTVVELIRQAIARGEKVLACAEQPGGR